MYFSKHQQAKQLIKLIKMKANSNKFHLGLDIGSISINTIVMNLENDIIESTYTYCLGKPFYALKDILKSVLSKYGTDNLQTLAFTGTGGQKASDILGGRFVNEIIAQSSSVAKLYPHVKTVIEMGGEDSKLIFMEKKESISQSELSDFAMNSLCAAGTGSFLDQQANRIGVSIENEFGELALKSEKPPRIAGRCSVFAKSDMIHLQQVATPLHDIVAGLCFAVARNFKSNLGKGKDFEKPIIFQGGVAANLGVVKAFTEILGLEKEELVIPEHYASMGAIGTLYHVLENPAENPEYKGLKALDEYLRSDRKDKQYLEPLEESKAVYRKEIVFNKKEGEKLPVYLGLDIGSLSTNVILIDDKDNIVARRYLPTASKPLNAIRRGLEEIYEEVGDSVVVKAAGTTGSGRYLTGDFIGADSIQNEITAQATAAIAYDPTVDTIFEIGGQDSKYISIENGVVVDFEMNKVCAAGTGSFLEEQAEKLGINIIKEFGELGLKSKQPAKFGDRCTVFMESDLNSHQQKGEILENLVAGLAYSIVHNYINRVVRDKPIGDKIFFQGGVTNNKSVVAAFEKVTGKKIIVPPHFDVTGAIGAAMLARNSMEAGQKSKFKGFDVSKTPYNLDKFTCKACSNVCEIQRIKIEGEEKPLFYGGRCDKWEVEERKNKGKDIPNLYEERLELLRGDYKEDEVSDKKTIGIPRGLMIYYQQFPFWRTFFEELGYQVVISKPTDQQLVKESVEISATETCFPVSVIHGHVNDLFEKKVDHIFIPFIVNVHDKLENPTANCNCPWVQSYPFMMRTAFPNEKDKFLIPTLHFRWEKVLRKELSKFFKKELGIPKSQIVKAIRASQNAQYAFEEKLQIRGNEILNNLPENKLAMVVLGRPYNTGDKELNLKLTEKLINMDVLPIPIDFLPLDNENIFDKYPSMYWPNGRKILQASRIVAKDERLYAVYMGNFRCGPDSFLTHYVIEEMKGKPHLHLEIDEHGADAGMITRLEAFLDSLKGYNKIKENKATTDKGINQIKQRSEKERTLYLPYMRDSAYALAAACRATGMKAEVLPMQTEDDVELGRKYTNGQECFPMICTTGSFLKKLEEPGVDPGKVSFFMPDHTGPCRFGQYNKLQRIIFDRLGYQDTEIFSPSNENSYYGIAEGQATKFRVIVWKGFVAIDMLRKMQQERRPYEIVKGQTDKVYNKALKEVEVSLETGAKDILKVMEIAAKNFREIPVTNGQRKPIIPIVGEIFMRDNAYCSGNLVKKLEDLGAETVMAPFSEWLSYSTYRYYRDSLWKDDYTGLFKSKIQEVGQKFLAKKIHNKVKDVAEMEREVHLKEMLERCNMYVDKDYDGDPAIAMGTAAILAKKDISGIVAILPFTCLPGTLVASISQLFRKDYKNIPWENIAYDGQQDSAIDTRLQAFMHQAKEYWKRNNKEAVTNK